jgi:hypothetical protein
MKFAPTLVKQIRGASTQLATAQTGLDNEMNTLRNLRAQLKQIKVRTATTVDENGNMVNNPEFGLVSELRTGIQDATTASGLYLSMVLNLKKQISAANAVLNGAHN